MSEMMPEQRAWYPYAEDDEPIVIDAKNPRPYATDPNSLHLQMIRVQQQREQELEQELRELFQEEGEQ